MQADALAGNHRTTVETFKAIVKENGVRGLWRGTSATFTRLALGAGAHFFFLDLLRPRFETHHPDGTRSLGVVGAAITGTRPRKCRLLWIWHSQFIQDSLEHTAWQCLRARLSCRVAQETVAHRCVLKIAPLG
jgi:Mitochondrial carrier protein